MRVALSGSVVARSALAIANQVRDWRGGVQIFVCEAYHDDDDKESYAKQEKEDGRRGWEHR